MKHFIETKWQNITTKIDLLLVSIIRYNIMRLLCKKLLPTKPVWTHRSKEACGDLGCRWLGPFSVGCRCTGHWLHGRSLHIECRQSRWGVGERLTQPSSALLTRVGGGARGKKRKPCIQRGHPWQKMVVSRHFHFKKRQKSWSRSLPNNIMLLVRCGWRRHGWLKCGEKRKSVCWYECSKYSLIPVDK